MSGLAFVSGAGSGIGRATVLRLAREGIRVTAADIDGDALEALAAEAGDGVRTEQLDVSDWQAVEAVAKRLNEEHGPFDHVVPAAGINPLADSTLAIDEAFFDRVSDINFKGAFAVCRALIPAMAAAGRGSAVLLASVSSLIGWGGSSVYIATKGALLALTRAMAIEYAAAGVRVNCVCPGSVRTPMVLDNLAKRGDLQTGLARAAARHPLGRVAEPEEVAEAIWFLLSERAAFVTGSALTIDGGLTAI